MDRESWSCKHGIYYGCADCNERADLFEELAALKQKLGEAREILKPIANIDPKYRDTGYWPDNYDISQWSKKAKAFLEAKSAGEKGEVKG